MHDQSQTRAELKPDRIAEAFRSAIDIALEFEGSTSPNPAVGCVLLDEDGVILACEAHQKAGQGHAEARAIEACRRNGTVTRIHTAVVTLEPCNHTGRTPPCVQALLSTPVEVVWIACRDPNPNVAGGGAAALLAAGVRVNFLSDLIEPRTAELVRKAERLVAPFAKKNRTGLPFITIKQAIDRNGSMIPPVGQKTFTSKSSLKLAHLLRRRADAILTGSGTILADNPEFTVRHVPEFEHKTRILDILDRRQRVPSHYIDSAKDRGFNVLIDSDVTEALARLGRLGVMEVLVEAGPTLTSAMQSAGQWDELVTIQNAATDDGDDTVSITRQKTQTGMEG